MANASDGVEHESQKDKGYEETVGGHKLYTI